MGYCTIADILNIIPEPELIRLTNDNPCSSSVIDTNRFEAVSTTTDSLIDGYLRARYRLPLKSTPKFIKQIAIDIYAYRLYSRRPHDIPEHIKENYKIAIANLREIQKGNLLCEDAGENPESDIPPMKSTIRTNKRTQDRIFSADVMRAYFKR